VSCHRGFSTAFPWGIERIEIALFGKRPASFRSRQQCGRTTGAFCKIHSSLRRFLIMRLNALNYEAGASALAGSAETEFKASGDLSW
jgi:hypothetical protein